MLAIADTRLNCGMSIKETSKLMLPTGITPDNYTKKLKAAVLPVKAQGPPKKDITFELELYIEYSTESSCV